MSDIDLLATTACWTAAIRTQESERVDRLFDDPWAAALAGHEGTAWLERMSGESGSSSNDSVVVRTRFFDDFLQRTTGRWPYEVAPRNIPGIPRSFLVTAKKGE